MVAASAASAASASPATSGASRWAGAHAAATLALACALGACASACGGPPPPSAPSPLLGKPAPDFRRPALDGVAIDTVSLRGKVTVVKFFAKYCAPCTRTLPAVQALRERRPEIAVVGVSEDEHASDAAELVRTYALTFPVVLDSGNVLSGRFRVSSLPATFVIDSLGVVRWVGGAGQSDDDLARAVAATR
ncbi:MAG: TlpA family protein disulfide reductase [Myxococcales bacterium]|nr:TlpA family protein disulfide reductase [Myxococcales bacterium]